MPAAPAAPTPVSCRFKHPALPGTPQSLCIHSLASRKQFGCQAGPADGARPRRASRAPQWGLAARRPALQWMRRTAPCAKTQSGKRAAQRPRGCSGPPAADGPATLPLGSDTLGMTAAGAAWPRCASRVQQRLAGKPPPLLPPPLPSPTATCPALTPHPSRLHIRWEQFHIHIIICFGEARAGERVGARAGGGSRGGCMAAAQGVARRRPVPPRQPGCPCLPPTPPAAGCCASAIVHLPTSAFQHSQQAELRLLGAVGRAALTDRWYQVCGGYSAAKRAEVSAAAPRGPAGAVESCSA